MKRIAGALLLALLLVVPGALRAEPSNPTREKLKELNDLLRQIQEMEHGSTPEFRFKAPKTTARLYDLADLTVQLPNFVRPYLTLRPAGSEVDEESPPFGKADEGERFFSGPEEIMDLIRANVRPDVWKSGSSRIDLYGATRMLVIAEPDVQKEVRSYIDGLRKSVGRTVTVKLRILRVPAGTELPPSEMSRTDGLALVAKAETTSPPELVGSARITGFSGQKVSWFGGRRQAFVQDYDVEVAKDSSAVDPVVGILQSGLSFDVLAVAHGEGSVRVDLDGEIVAVDDPIRTIQTTAGMVQAPRTRNYSFATTLTMKEGAFTLVNAGTTPDGGRIVLLVSARSDHMVGGGGR